MERVVVQEGHLVGLAADRRLHVEVAELIRRSAGGRIDESLAVQGNVRPGPVERLLGKHRRRLQESVFLGRNPEHVSGAERHAAVGDDEQLTAAGKPGRGDRHVPGAEVEPVVPVVVVPGDGDLVSRPLPVFDRAHVDVEVAVRLRGHVGEPAAIGREHGVDVDLVVAGEGVGFTRLEVQDLELDRRPSVVGRVDEPLPVGRDVGQRVVLLVVGEFPRLSRVRIDLPDRSAHRHRDPLPVGRPVRRPGRRTRRRREVEVVHVVPALPCRRVGVSPWRLRQRGGSKGRRDYERHSNSPVTDSNHQGPLHWCQCETPDPSSARLF